MVKPSVQATHGRPGVPRLYSFRDLVALRAIRSLLEGGMSLQRVRRAIQFLRKKAALEEQLSAVKLLTDGRTIFHVSRSERELLDALKQGQLAFFVAIDDAVARVDARSTRYLYDQQEFFDAVKRLESNLEREIATSAGRRRASTAR